MATHLLSFTEKLASYNRAISLAFVTFLLAASPAHAEHGVTADEILLGQSTALTGSLAELGKDASIAAKAYFDYVNQQGGVNGRMIRLITLDDAYNTEKAAANAKTLIEKEMVFALFNMMGTPANMALLPVIEQAGIPSIAPYTGSQAPRTPLNRLVFNLRAGYADETEKIIEHLIIRGIDKIAVVYQNNAFGKEGVGVVVSQVAPFPFSATSGIVREYQQVMTKMGVKNRSFTSMEGFLNAKIAVEGFKRAGRDLTRERFVNALESLGKIDFDGYLVNYSKANHQGSRYVELTVISRDGRFLR